MRGDRARPPLPGRDDERLELGDDRSVKVHACHGRARQVEVLRDAILHELAEDPTLEPRDVIVMCPDIETFAPLIQATFGFGEDWRGGPERRHRGPAPQDRRGKEWEQCEAKGGIYVKGSVTWLCLKREALLP